MLTAGVARAEERAVVVELFTSQGCSSCPPADEILHRLSERDNVIALALHVDYWDYIGWADSFARPENTVRQRAYARAAGEKMIYTPQMIIGGADRVVGARAMDVMDSIDAHLAQGQPVPVRVTRSGDMLRITAERPAEIGGALMVQLVRYRPRDSVKITRGENKGRTLSYANIVTAWDVIGKWEGGDALDLTVAIDGDEPSVVIVQRPAHGEIVGAAQTR